MERTDRTRGQRYPAHPISAGEVLLEDPYHPYAADLIDLFAARHGMRSVVLYTDVAAMRSMAASYPALRGPNVAASYVVEHREIGAVARMLARDHDIRAVAPHAEPTIADLARIAELLHLDWAQPGVIDRFRDKHALKEFLRSVPDGPRINAVARVRTREEVLDAVASGCFDRFVLKPNDGFGNSLIGFFDTWSDDLGARLDDYLAELDGRQLVMEEYVGGEEYFVNGQIDGTGGVLVYEVSRYVRGSLNGRPNVALGSLTLRTSDPLFPLIVDYVTVVMRASQLRRSPFHLELKIDDRGPCLIEVAARHCGNERVYDDNEMHGRLDALALTAHYYVTAADYGDAGLDWDSYDSAIWGHVNGTSSTEGRIRSLSGVREVERSDGFVKWVDRPRIGDHLEPTHSIFQQPWLAVVHARSAEELLERGEWMRDTVRWNAPAPRPVTAARSAAALVPPALRRARRAGRRLVPPVRTTAWTT